MKFQCNRAALHEAVQLASSIVPPRTPKPILQCARINADADSKVVTVTATDGEISVQYTITQVQIETGGATVVPADRLASILHESNDETVNLELTDATCQVVDKDSKFRIYGHDPDDYPVMDMVGPENPLLLQAAVLRRMIHMSVFSAARENTRYAINGVLWEQQGKKLRMVATDGRRLAKVEGAAVSVPADLEITAIVPAKAMQLIERMLHDPEEKVQIGVTENQISVSTTAVLVVSNLVQGRFPKYTDVIPDSCEHKVQVNTELLRSGVRRVALLTNDQSRGVSLSFNDNCLQLTSSTPEAGEAEVKLPVAYQEEALRIGFNPQYLLEALRVVDEPEVVFEMIDGEKPGVLRAGKDFLYVLMPVSV
jgi:DNA polymerase III subunit beta